MKLSIIICVYNTSEKYFEKCLSSIYNSTLKNDDYEILVIDDGSYKDYSIFEKTYPIRIIKTENQGIFKARLLGIKEARGEYTAFVDSDDTVTFNFHRPMLETAIKTNSDIVFNDWAFHTERTRYCCLSDSTISENFEYEADKCLLSFAKNEGREHSFFVLWNKMFKSGVLKSNYERLIDIANAHGRYNYSEDALICFFAFKSCKRCKNIHTGYYFYRIHSNQNVNIESEKKLTNHIKHMSCTLDIMKNNIGENKYYNLISNHLDRWSELMSRTHYSHAKANNYIHLYDYIKSAYHVSILKKSAFKDNSAYSKNKVLPYNIEKIDNELINIWRSIEYIEINPKNFDTYTKNSIKYITDTKSNIRLSKDGISLTAPKTKLKDKFLMNKLVYSLGLILFKKGSKIRSFLKKHI